MPFPVEITLAFSTDYSGFAAVKRKNNPLREEALVHRSLGKIGAVEPAETETLVSRLSCQASLPGDWPIIGLSESSILLGRLVAENHSGSRFIYSTRYPEPGMVAFDEPHSHAPAHYLSLNGMDHYDRLCIVEDEITSGNTVMNLMRVLAVNIHDLKRVHIMALKVMCSDRRLHEMKDSALLLGIELTFGWLHREYRHDEETLKIWANPVSDWQSGCGSSRHSEWEKGRGRLEPFMSEDAAWRSKMWQSKLDGLDLSNEVVCIGASESIDLAYELASICKARVPSYYRHFTMSPWELPGWAFHEEGKRTLFLYNPPSKPSSCILVYDQADQTGQVESLGLRLKKNGSRVYVMKHNERDFTFDEIA